jgi:hypothetical protein
LLFSAFGWLIGISFAHISILTDFVGRYPQHYRLLQAPSAGSTAAALLISSASSVGSPSVASPVSRNLSRLLSGFIGISLPSAVSSAAVSPFPPPVHAAARWLFRRLRPATHQPLRLYLPIPQSFNGFRRLLRFPPSLCRFCDIVGFRSFSFVGTAHILRAPQYTAAIQPAAELDIEGGKPLFFALEQPPDKR